MPTEYSSQHRIGDNILFLPMARHCMAMGVAKEEKAGRIVAIRITEAKMFYDVLSLYHGTVFDAVDSDNVTAIAPR